MKYVLSFLILTVFLTGCMSPTENGKVVLDLKSRKAKVPVGGSDSPEEEASTSSAAVITNITLVNDQLIVDGTDLGGVSNVNLNDGGSLNVNLTFVTQTASQLVLSAASNFFLPIAGSLLNLVMTDAQGAGTTVVTFQLPVASVGTAQLVDGSVTLAKLDSMGAANGEVLIYDSSGGGAWVPTPLSGLSYKGTWNATANTPTLSDNGATTSPTAGDYYTVGTGGATTIDGVATWVSGDWIIFNGTDWQRINNAGTVLSFKGRTGGVTPAANDYTWAQIDKTSSPIDDLSDVDTTTAAPNVGEVLKWDGTNWIPGSGSSGAVTSSDITNGTIVDADINAAAAIAQSKISGLGASLAAKQGTITTGTTSQYFKGDFSLGTFNTDTIAAPITGFSSGAGALAATDTVLESIEKLDGNISANTTAIGTKEGSITAAATTTYFRGDKTFVTLDTAVVAENTNLYFTDVRARGAVLTGYSSGAGTVSATDTILQAIQKLNGNIAALTSSAGDITDGGNTNAATVVIGTNDANSLQLETNNSVAMTILSSGNVGIGTATPGVELEVNGSIESSEYSSNATNEESVSGTYPPTKMVYRFSEGRGIGYNSADDRIYFAMNETVPMVLDNSGNIGIGTTVPNSTSLLDISSTTQGFLSPRMTTTQRDAIGSPATGLQVYNTTTNALNYFNGTIWTVLGVAGSGLTSLGGETGSTQIFAVGTTGTTPAIVSATNTHTLNIPLASGAGVTSGTITKTEYDSFVAKQGSITTGTTAQYLKGDLSLGTFNTDAIAAPIAGFSSGAGAVAATDTVLEAIEKLDGNITASGDITGITTGDGLTGGFTSGTSTLAIDLDTNPGLEFNSGKVKAKVNTGLSLDTNGINVDIDGTTAETTADNADTILIYDDSGTVTRKMTRGNFLSGLGGSGDITDGGNTEAATVIIGTNDANSLQLETNNSTAMTILSAGNVGIGTATPDSTSLLDISSTTKGFLPPRMTTTQRDAITTPATGLTIYNTTTTKLNIYNGSTWGEVGSGGGGLPACSNNDKLFYSGSAWYCESAANTKILMHMDGANTSTTFTDSSLSPKTIAVNGDAQISTAQSKFGGSSVLFDGSGDFLSIPASSDTTFGTGDFTIDFWVYSNGSGSAMTILGNRVAVNNDTHWNFEIASGTNSLQVHTSGTVLFTDTDNTLSPSQWNHVGWTREGTTNRLFINGVIVQTVTNSFNFTDSTSPVLIGKDGHGGGAVDLDGYIDELRIVKGSAIWTSGFSVPTSAYSFSSSASSGASADNLGDHTATQNISLGSNYLSGDGGNEGIQIDSSGKVTFAQDATFTGNVDMSGATIVNNSISVDDLNFASSNGINIPQLASDPSSPTTGQQYFNTTSNTLKVYNGSTWVGVGSGGGDTFPTCVEGDTLVFENSAWWCLSDSPSNSIFLVHGDGVDTSTTFTDVTASPHTLTTNGDAQVDTAQSKFGGASMYFDGAGDYITAPDSEDFNLSTGDFTIDFWFRAADVSAGYRILVAQYDNGTYPSWAINQDGTDIQLTSSSTGSSHNIAFGRVLASGISVNTWYHFALVRNGNDWKSYLDGVLTDTLNTALSPYNSTHLLRIGASDGATHSFSGWIDEVRISKGAARWDSAFTPPVLAYDLTSGSTGGSSGGALNLADTDGDTKIQVEESSDEDKIHFDTAGSERMVIDNSGNVGIGTTTPSGPFHVKTTVNHTMTATGGTITTSGGYTIHTFTSSGTFTPSISAEVEVLIVGGGGGGGSYANGGGGGGGLIHKTEHSVTASSYTITVGGGGVSAADGSSSSFDSLVAVGGAVSSGAASSGGSGAGTAHGTTTGIGGAATQPSQGGDSGTYGYGNAGGGGTYVGPNYGAGGGGGAGTAGATGTSTKGGNGGDGLQLSISGTPTYYAGGGGGGTYAGGTSGTGGLGGGGDAGTGTSDGIPNTGGGAGASSTSASNGGSGIVIIRYLTPGTVVTTDSIVVTSNGNVGIGTITPSHKLHVIGTAGLSTGTAWTNTSDIRLKDIRGDYKHGLDEIMKLHTVKFNYKKGNELGLPSDKEIIGFIAQEVQKVIPEAVVEREDGFLELNVDPIHWAMVNAIQEQQEIIDRNIKMMNIMQGQISENSREIASLKDRLKKIESENTEMKFFLCSKFKDAAFCQ